MKEAAERGIIVTNVPSYGEHTVAEYAFGLILSLTRRLPEAFEDALDGYGAHANVRGIDIFGKTIGIVGGGRIGCQVARIANGFGMQAMVYDPFPNDERAAEFNFRYVGLDELLAGSDVVTLHAVYTPENHHLINTEQLEKMKPTAYLVNAARGELLNTKALISALQDKKLMGAALDVLEGEALLMNPEEIALLRAESMDPMLLQHSLEINILKKMSNVLITQHNAFNTLEAIERINNTAKDNIDAFLRGEIRNEVH
jgi:D-lactate dehydrogenase